jgi:hypothetical protein
VTEAGREWNRDNDTDSELRAQKRRHETAAARRPCHHALLSPVALGLELRPGINLFAWCMAGSLTSATGRGINVGCRDPCHRSTWGVVSHAPPWRSRLWQTGSDKAIADSHTAAQSEWLERAGGGGQPRSSGFFLQLVNIDRVCRGAVTPLPYFRHLYYTALGWQ